MTAPAQDLVRRLGIVRTDGDTARGPAKVLAVEPAATRHAGDVVTARTRPIDRHAARLSP